MSSLSVSDYLGTSLRITIQDDGGGKRPVREKPTPRSHANLKLISGFDMPLIGLATHKIPNNEVNNIVLNALKIGYRFIDTAYDYGNESEIGEAINTWVSRYGGDREDLFISSKVPVYGNRPEDVEKYLLQSLARLQLTYVDLYSIHMPFALKPNADRTGPADNECGGKSEMQPVNHEALWQVFHKMVAKGLVRSIGLCNFNERQLIRVLNFNMNNPDCLQIECNVALQQSKLVATCRTLGIAVTAICPLGYTDGIECSDSKNSLSKPKLDLVNDPVVKKIADSVGKSPVQVLLRFLVQQNIAVLTKTTNIDRMRENLDVLNFSLSQEEIDQLKKLEQGEKARIVTFMHYKGIGDHEEYPF